MTAHLVYQIAQRLRSSKSFGKGARSPESRFGERANQPLEGEQPTHTVSGEHNNKHFEKKTRLD